MATMTKDEFDLKMARLKRKNENIEYRRMLRAERTKYWPKLKKPSTGKIALWAGFVLMLEVVIFCQYLAIKTYDATPLVGVIGGIGGWMSMFISYNKKSSIENSKDGIIYETAMAALNNVASELTDAVG